jgi:parallel beta-helix repeat protein
MIMTIESGKSVRRLWYGVAVTLTLSVSPGFNRALQAAPPIPVTVCGQDLSTAGGNYLLATDLSCNGDAITISADNVRFTLNGFSITSNDGLGSGISVISGTGPVVGVQIKGPGQVTMFNIGISLYKANDSRVAAVTLAQNKTGVGISLSDGARVTDSVISSSGESGVSVVDSQNGLFSSNTVTSSALAGYFLSGATNNVIASNDVSSNAVVGIQIQDASNGNVVQKNTANNSNQSGTRGIVVTNSTNNTVRSNAASGNEIGIHLTVGTTGTTVQTNTVNTNVVGIVVLQGATGNMISKNTALGNSGIDLADANPGCDSNTWSQNTFVIDQVAGIPDGGPGTGCIQ